MLSPIFLYSFFFLFRRLYLKNFCLGCGERINSEELVMRTIDNVFHLKCFSCVVCGIQLQKGEQYVVKQSQLFCRSDYEKEVEMLQGYNGESSPVTKVNFIQSFRFYLNISVLQMNILLKICFRRRSMVEGGQNDQEQY